MDSDVEDLGVAWQQQCRRLNERGAKLLASGVWTDCEFVVGSARVHVRAHKLMLVATSEVFERMFYGALAEQSLVCVEDMEPEPFRAMLHYIYTDKIQLTSCHLACEVYYGAKKYLIPYLQAECAAYLSSNLSPDTVCSTYEFVQLVGDMDLEEKCIEVMESKTNEVLEASSFPEAHINTVVRLFSLERLNIMSEMQLVEAAEWYALTQDSKDMDVPDKQTSNIIDVKETVTESRAPCDEEIKKKLRVAVQNIRFLTLAPKEFAESGSLYPLLTDSEIMAIAMNLISQNTPVPMPSGFSTDRKNRLLYDYDNDIQMSSEYKFAPTITKTFC